LLLVALPGVDMALALAVVVPGVIVHRLVLLVTILQRNQLYL
jgi:hypothetical protein